MTFPFRACALRDLRYVSPALSATLPPLFVCLKSTLAWDDLAVVVWRSALYFLPKAVLLGDKYRAGRNRCISSSASIRIQYCDVPRLQCSQGEIYVYFLSHVGARKNLAQKGRGWFCGTWRGYFSIERVHFMCARQFDTLSVMTTPSMSQTNCNTHDDDFAVLT